MRYFILPSNNLFLTMMETGTPYGVEGVDWTEVFVTHPDLNDTASYYWNSSTDSWDYVPYRPPYQPKAVISVVDEAGEVDYTFGTVELVIVMKQDGTHSVRARNVTDNQDGTWTIGSLL